MEERKTVLHPGGTGADPVQPAGGMSVEPEILVAVLSLVGTLGGSLLGVVASSSLTRYRIEQLEKKVQAHNNLVERTYQLEGRMTEMEHDVRDLKRG